MIPKSRILPILITIILLNNCRKEDEIEGVRTGIIGCNSCNIYMSFDSLEITGGFNSISSFELDVNKDGFPDYVIEGWFNGSPGGMNVAASRIRSLSENAKIASALKSDSIVSWWVYSKVDSSIQPPPTFDSTAMFTRTNYHDSLDIPENYHLNITENFYARPLEFNFIVDNSLLWKSDTLGILEKDLTSYYFVEGTVLFGYQDNVSHGLWENEYDRYLGIMLEEKYGWIHLKVNHASSLVLYDCLLEK